MSKIADRVEILPVPGIGEIRPGTDLGAVLTAAAGWVQDGDILVVTSKIVSKAEGRLLEVGSQDPDQREKVRQKAIDDETVRVVARRGDLRIVVNRNGVVLAGAGVDASNVDRGEIALLPLNPDDSANRLRESFRARLRVDVGVIISDSLGRAWRNGIVDLALGVSGLAAVSDLRGSRDGYGNELQATQIAIADEIASAADLVKGKLTGIPVAVVRGLHLRNDGAGSAPLVRMAHDDMFRLGTNEAMALGRADAIGSDNEPGRLHADALEVIRSLPPTTDRAENAVRQGFLGFLLARPDAVWRSCTAGHITASTIVLDPSRSSVLLTLHPRVGRWLQLGGHCEPSDATVLDAAAREAREESGIGSLSLDPTPISLDIHPITCSLGVPNRHYDVCFLAVSSPGAQPSISDESLDLRWFDWDHLPPEVEDDLGPAIRRARARLEA